jgi:type II secretory pathway component PulC
VALARNRRFETGLVLTTLALCAFFLSQGATALVGAKVLGAEPTPEPRRTKVPTSASQNRGPRDSAIILRRNIFDSALGDLTQLPVEEGEQIDGEIVLDGEQALTSCTGNMRLIGTAVIPNDFERSVALIVGASGKNTLHQGGAEVDGSRMRAIYADSIVLQTASGGFCELAMFEVGTPAKPRTPTPKPAPKPKKKEKPSRPTADRNAGLTAEELDNGIQVVGPTSIRIDRALLSKVLDNSGKLIGIAAVTPKIEGGKSVGLEIQGIRPNTLLDKLGLHNGDLLESINGKPLIGTDAALEAYTLLRTADKFTLAVKRGGQTLNINYNID